LKNFFAALPPTAQNILADDETIAILELMLQVCPKKRPSCHDLLQHEYFKDLDPNFKLHIDGLHTQKPQFVDVDDSQLGKRVREVTEIVDLDIEVGKR
jgi:serine/threonine protein kinase